MIGILRSVCSIPIVYMPTRPCGRTQRPTQKHFFGIILWLRTMNMSTPIHIYVYTYIYTYIPWSSDNAMTFDFDGGDGEGDHGVQWWLRGTRNLISYIHLCIY